MPSYPKSLEELKSVPCPNPTPGWSPISHYEAVKMCMDALTDTGYTVTGNTYELTRSNLYLFACLMVDHPSINTYVSKPIIGIRSSLNQRFSYNLFTGGYTLIEDSRDRRALAYLPVYAFYEKISFGRKTSSSVSQLPRQLRAVCMEAVGRLHTNAANSEILDSVYLSDDIRDHILVNCVQQQALAPSKINAVLDLLTVPPNADYSNPSALKLEHLIGYVMNSSSSLINLVNYTCFLRQRLLEAAYREKQGIDDPSLSERKAPERVFGPSADQSIDEEGISR